MLNWYFVPLGTMVIELCSVNSYYTNLIRESRLGLGLGSGLRLGLWLMRVNFNPKSNRNPNPYQILRIKFVYSRFTEHGIITGTTALTSPRKLCLKKF